MNTGYYNLIRHEYFEEMGYHPVYGGWGKPVEMNETQFISYSRKHGNQWWNWDFFEPHTPTEEEMIDELEFIHGSLFRRDRNGKVTLRIKPRTIHLLEPVERVAKYNTKKGKRTIVYQTHLPIGNPIDRRVVRHKCMEAHKQIMNGMSVSVALKTYHIKYNSLLKYSGYVPKRNVEIDHKVRGIMDELKKDPDISLSGLLRTEGMSSSTFWRKTGGKNKVLTYLSHDVTNEVSLTIE